MTCHVARRRSEFESRLRCERRQAYEALATTDAELAGHERHHPGEFADDAATEMSCRLLASLEERDRHAIAEIDAAEARLAQGTFGVCAVCARPIGIARLRALPTARLCIPCEDAMERRAL